MKVEFGKDKTLIVKGFAIIFMMLLHCYGGENYDVTLDFSHAPLANINGVFKICVGMFTFMVGYGYAFSKYKDWNYSLKHVKKLLIPFWTILIGLTIIPLIICNKSSELDFVTFLLNLVGVDSSYNYYSWFVYFFIYAMIIMPFASRFINKKPLLNSCILIIIAYVLEIIVHAIPNMLDNKPLHALFNCLMQTPGMLLGYFFAHKKIYEKIVINNKTQLITIGLIMSILPFLFRHFYSVFFGFNLDFFYAPIVIGGIVIIFNVFRMTIISKILQEFGKVSVWMWFFHALFFTQIIRFIYQPLITLFSNINLVVIWAIIFTFTTSLLMNLIYNLIKKRSNSDAGS